VTTDLLQRDVRAALRQLLATVIQATVTATNLSVTGTGYTRAAGSFLADGFLPGAELRASGFGKAGNNGTAQLLAVSATTLTVDTAQRPVPLSAESAGATATLAIAMPAASVLEGTPTPPPKATAPHWRDFVLRAPESSRRVSVGVGARRRHRGIYQITLFYPLTDAGPGAAEAMADAVRQVLEANETLLYNQRLITLSNPSVASGGTDAPWFHVPVSVRYYTDTVS
jgi:hypothetical protein